MTITIRVNPKTGKKEARLPRDPVNPVKVVVIPPPSNFPKHSDEYKEAQVARVELAMLRGMREQRHVAIALEMSTAEVAACIRRIKGRWSVLGSERDLHEYRGELLSRMLLYEQGLWRRIDRMNEEEAASIAALAAYEALPAKERTKSNKPARYHFPNGMYLALMGNIQSNSQRRAEMLGVTPDMIQNIVTTEGKDALDFNKAGQTHEIAARMYAQLLAVVEKREAEAALMVAVNESN